MASLKDVKAKIGGVKKTRQITKAMNMVAASRLRGAQLTMEGFRPYAQKFGEVLGRLSSRAQGGASSPLLVPKPEVRNVQVILCTSDRGLCGGFNTSLISAAEKLYKQYSEKGVPVVFTLFGKKGRDWARSGKLTSVAEHIGVVGTRVPFNVASKTGTALINGFLGGEVDEVFLVYSRFDSMSRQTPVVQQLLPIPAISAEETKGGEEKEQKPELEHLCEPSAEGLLSKLFPRHISVQIYKALLETSTSEHAARMMAMDNATKACNDMLDQLTLVYNKARQAAITKELMDIVGGAEALKG